MIPVSLNFLINSFIVFPDYFSVSPTDPRFSSTIARFQNKTVWLGRSWRGSSWYTIHESTARFCKFRTVKYNSLSPGRVVPCTLVKVGWSGSGSAGLGGDHHNTPYMNQLRDSVRVEQLRYYSLSPGRAVPCTLVKVGWSGSGSAGLGGDQHDTPYMNQLRDSVSQGLGRLGWVGWYPAPLSRSAGQVVPCTPVKVGWSGGTLHPCQGRLVGWYPAPLWRSAGRAVPCTLVKVGWSGSRSAGLGGDHHDTPYMNQLRDSVSQGLGGLGWVGWYPAPLLWGFKTRRSGSAGLGGDQHDTPYMNQLRDSVSVEHPWSGGTPHPCGPGLDRLVLGVIIMILHTWTNSETL